MKNRIFFYRNFTVLASLTHLKGNHVKIIIGLLFCLTLLFPAYGQHITKDQPYMRYHIEVKTSSASHSGTDNDVRIELFGDKGSTGLFSIRGNKEKGGTDRFTVVHKDIGKIHKIKVDVSFNLADKWRCEYIAVTKNASRTNSSSSDGYYKFNINHYFGKTAYEFTPYTVRNASIPNASIPTTSVRYLDKTDRDNGTKLWHDLYYRSPGL